MHLKMTDFQIIDVWYHDRFLDYYIINLPFLHPLKALMAWKGKNTTCAPHVLFPNIWYVIPNLICARDTNNQFDMWHQTTITNKSMLCLPWTFLNILPPCQSRIPISITRQSKAKSMDQFLITSLTSCLIMWVSFCDKLIETYLQ